MNEQIASAGRLSVKRKTARVKHAGIVPAPSEPPQTPDQTAWQLPPPLPITPFSTLFTGLAGEDPVGGTFGAIQEIAPANATEAMLAIQMVGVHQSALGLLRRAMHEGQPLEATEVCGSQASKLMRLFHDRATLTAKLKGKSGKQKVTVEHVHVHEGGQAIVGAVTTGGDNRKPAE